tara:strand:- start:164 stop:889 length:726 start_codon:yes stop_codon:yes gene_type:complete
LKNYNNKKQVLFVIPARSGSKGVKNKNLKICAGESLLRRAVKIAKEMSYESRIIVSTDSELYLKHVEDLDCSLSFLRPAYLSGDSIGDLEVLTQTLHAAEVEFNENYMCVTMLQPTSPLRRKQHIHDSVNAVIRDLWDASFTAHRVDLKYHPLKSLTITSEGSSKYYIEEGSKIKSRQMLNQTFIRNGACYSITPLCLTNIKSFIGNHSKIIETEPMISIDSIDEINECESIINKRNNTYY